LLRIEWKSEKLEILRGCKGIGLPMVWFGREVETRVFRSTVAQWACGAGADGGRRRTTLRETVIGGFELWAIGQFIGSVIEGPILHQA